MSICQEHPKEMLSQGFRLKLVGKGFMYHERAWSIKDLLYGFQENFSCRTWWVVPSGQDNSILPARVANHSLVYHDCCLATTIPCYLSFAHNGSLGESVWNRGGMSQFHKLFIDTDPQALSNTK